MTDNCVFGMAVAGAGNIIEANSVMGSGVDGLAIAGTNNTVQGNAISANRRYGADLGGSGNHIVRDNLFIQNGVIIQGGGAIAVFAGDNTQILQNLATGNFDGIFLQTAGNLVEGNTTTNNVTTGIAIGAPGATNVVQNNTATGNGAVDLSDFSAACGSNTWHDNVFVTDSVAGASDGGPAAGCIAGIFPVPVGTSTVAGTDTAVPGGTGVFTDFPQAPAIGGGSIAFVGAGSGGQTGLYVAIPPNPIVPIADLATLIPNGTGTFTGFSAMAAGDARTSFIGSGSGGQTGVYVAIPPNPIVPVADRTTSIPNGIGTFTGFASVATGDARTSSSVPAAADKRACTSVFLPTRSCLSLTSRRPFQMERVRSQGSPQRPPMAPAPASSVPAAAVRLVCMPRFRQTPSCRSRI